MSRTLWRSQLAVAAAYALFVTDAAAVTLTPDYSSLGTVYQDATGNLYSSAAADRTDVTALMKTDISAAFTYLQNAILLPWTETVTFKIYDLGPITVANSGIDTVTSDAAKRPATSTVTYTVHSGFPMFIDPTPFDNSEFTMSTGTAALGGGTENNKRFGNATAGGGAKDKWDFLTLTLHEVEHSLGISNGQGSGFTRFLDLVGASNSTTDRKLTIPKALSGLPNDFDIPIVKNTSHFIGDPTNNDTFGFAVVSDPGWSLSQRALPTCLDILAIGRVEGAAANQIYCETLVPEPGTIVLVGMALMAGAGYRRRR